MTIAAGFLCPDGIVVCADREVATDADKYEESKIFTLHPDSIDINPQIVFAGSGWHDFVKMTVDKIREQVFGLTEPQDINRAIEKVILEVHRKHIRWYPSNPKPYFSLVLAIRYAADDMALFNTSGTSMIRVPEWSCIGTGDTLASYLSRALTPDELPTDEAAFVAAQIIDQVKKNVPGCGGQFSEVVILPKRGALRRLRPLQLLQVEYRTRDVGSVLKPLLLSLSNPTLTDSEFEEELRTFVSECKRLRREHKRSQRRIEKKRATSQPKP